MNLKKDNLINNKKNNNRKQKKMIEEKNLINLRRNLLRDLFRLELWLFYWL